MLTFRLGFASGVGVAITLSLFLVWHWQPKRQVRLHSEHFLQRVQMHAWTSVSAQLASDYRDQWSHDRASVVADLRAAMLLLRGVEIIVAMTDVNAADREGSWSARITLRGGGENGERVVTQVNAFQAPFTFRWRQQSAKPWDWQLVSVAQPELERMDAVP